VYKSALYLKSSIVFQTILINIKSIVFKVVRENFIYKARVRKLMSNCELPRSLMLSENKASLDKILKEASLGTSAYAGLGGDIKNYPKTTKKDIQGCPSSYRNRRKLKGFTFKSSTGGTTGKPLELIADLHAIIEDQAQSYRQLVWAGFSKGDKRIWLRADLIVPITQDSAPYWRNNRVDNMLMMSAYHINQSTLIDYIKELNRYQPRIIQAYPSAIYLLAKLISTSNYALEINLKSIVLSSESYSMEQKEFIERVFNCPVFSWYGLSERVATVGTCSAGELHLIEDYGLHEFDDNGVLIATGFHNRAMPIVRYDTGDRFKGVEEEFTPCQCGLPFRRVNKIEGRVGEYLYSDTGTRVSIFNHIPKGVVGLVELQLVQHRHKHVDAIVVHTELFDSASKTQLVNNIKGYLGNSTEVKIVETNKIDRTRSGKFRQAICHIKD
jgi:phenylacetate-CoA ligase